MVHPDFYTAKRRFYDKCNFQISQLRSEKESQEYGACTFMLDGYAIRFRVSKITPNKTGQFVTLWKRNQNGVTEPFDITDEFDFVVICSRCGNHFGQFLFSKSVLLAHGIISGGTKNGKRGIRVYPPWDEATNKQAQKTQEWQMKYFQNSDHDDASDISLIRKVFSTS
ncbi:MAG: MepB family protein [Cyclobacteriaceae bacterium]|nr:MepB family protein [Cyclobacteriaceae bacterium HetDA_MAG_MS6]